MCATCICKEKADNESERVWTIKFLLYSIVVSSLHPHQSLARSVLIIIIEKQATFEHSLFHANIVESVCNFLDFRLHTVRSFARSSWLPSVHPLPLPARSASLHSFLSCRSSFRFISSRLASLRLLVFTPAFDWTLAECSICKIVLFSIHWYSIEVNSVVLHCNLLCSNLNNCTVV